MRCTSHSRASESGMSVGAFWLGAAIVACLRFFAKRAGVAWMTRTDFYRNCSLKFARFLASNKCT